MDYFPKYRFFLFIRFECPINKQILSYFTQDSMSYHSSGQMLDWGHQQTPKLLGTKYRYFGHGFPGFFLHNQSDWETGKVVEKTEACVISYVSWCFYGDRCKQGANFKFEMLLLLILISFETFSFLVFNAFLCQHLRTTKFLWK